LGSLQTFVADRKREGVKNRTVNLSLSMVRRILNLSARVRRDEDGKPSLDPPALIQMLPLNDARRPYPLSWDEQRALFKTLPDYLAQMRLFKVNTGMRDQEVCQLRWDWEIPVLELDTSVFLTPAEFVKNREDRLVVLNRVAKSVVEEVRRKHEEFVFTYRGKQIFQMNNTAWQNARKKVGLPQLRIHDLKHSFGRRLRSAGVSNETRKVLLRHRNGDITTHYSAPELEELIEAANKVCELKSGTGCSEAESKNPLGQLSY